MIERAPIALFVYNRPWHMRQTVEALRKNEIAAESDLFIFSDASKTGEADVGVLQVREFIHGILGFKSVTVMERPRNLGLDPSIIDGVTRLCAQFGRVIVLEDDLIVAPHFLDYMNRALSRYADEERVMQVSGYMFPVELPIEAHSLFLPFTTSWGWAVWQRSWQHFDPLASGYAELRESRKMRNAFDLGGVSPYFDMLENVVNGRGDHWDIRWYLSVFMRQGLTLCPAKTLVVNIGFDGSGTNCGEGELMQSDFSDGFRANSFPEVTAVSAASGLVVQALKKALKRSFLGKVKNWICRFPA